MPRHCTVCGHEELEHIDFALVAGASLRDIAGRHGVSKSALERHKADHLPTHLTRANEAEEAARADNLLSQVRGLQARTLAILETAEVSGELRTALAAIGEARRNLELLGKLAGELDQRPVVNILVSAEWVAIRTVLLEVLSPYPQASAAVAERLMELGGS
jgi:transposase-like protein